MSHLMEQATQARNALEDALDETDRLGKSLELLRGFAQLALLQKRAPEDSCEQVLVENLIPTYLRDFFRKYDRFRPTDVDSAWQIAMVFVLTEDHMDESINKSSDELKEYYSALKNEFDSFRKAMKNHLKMDKDKLLAHLSRMA